MAQQIVDVPVDTRTPVAFGQGQQVGVHPDVNRPPRALSHSVHYTTEMPGVKEGQRMVNLPGSNHSYDLARRASKRLASSSIHSIPTPLKEGL
jgi:hypothetical protein